MSKAHHHLPIISAVNPALGLVSPSPCRLLPVPLCGAGSRSWSMTMNDLRTMSIFTATMIAEGVEPVETEEEYLAAWQVLINTDTCWKLQGWFGRTAADLIANGYCHPKEA
jgi:hypothetical protein